MDIMLRLSISNDFVYLLTKRLDRIFLNLKKIDLRQSQPPSDIHRGLFVE
jgi:hypothetical protein